MTVLAVRRGGTDAGAAVPHYITQHAHPKARPEDPGSGDDTPRATGIDYLALLGEQHDRQAAAQSTTPPSSPPPLTKARPPSSSRNKTSRDQPRRTAVDDFRQVIDLDQTTSDDTLRLARTAAEAIRGLNHATRQEAVLDQPSAAYDIIGALNLTASRVPQLLTQIDRWLGQALAAGRLGHDLGQDPAAAIDAAGIFLHDACTSAAALAGDLNQAQQQLALINGRPRNHYHREQP
jgi:hypothetical protein